MPKDEVRAGQLFTSGCDRGDGDGCVAWGALYEQGRGVPKDEARAVEIYRKGCEVFGGPRACTALGRAYAEGRGVPRDPVQAAKLFHEGCRSGHEEACAAAKRLTP